VTVGSFRDRDRCFIALAALTGILFYPDQGRSIGQVIRAAQLLCEPVDMSDQVHYL